MEKSSNHADSQQGLTQSQKSKLRTYKSRYINKHKFSPEEAHAAALHDVLNPRRKTRAKSKVHASSTDEVSVMEPVAQTGSDSYGRVIEFPRPKNNITFEVAHTDAGASSDAYIAPVTSDAPATGLNVAPQDAVPTGLASELYQDKNDQIDNITAPATPTPVTTVNVAPAAALIVTPPAATDVAPPLGFVAPPAVTLTETGYKPRFSWSSTPAPKKVQMSTEKAQLQGVLSGVGLAVCLVALVIFQARAGHMTVDAIFWAIMSEVAGVVLWAFPAAGLRKLGLCVLGTLFIVLGFLVMHIDIESGTTQLVETRVSNALSVTTLESQIERKKDSLNALVTERNKLPATYLTARAKVQNDIKALESEVTELENQLLAERRLVADSKSASVVERLGDIEDLRRIGLVLLAIVCAHGFFAALPVLLSSRKSSIAV
ncbi:MAG TPA: hypothetical protein VFO10_18125 [Oligoflexus sp.]|uniref:hypothetical protein n=1 Tax=Oligoflexus sp. TaxID=1971216 RepID=UPI002D7F8BF6|nr:hypothetical protein [Oligoflexus sp.]HET9239183.1 hypothetical protein [Oligoflexus sp.]